MPLKTLVFGALQEMRHYNIKVNSPEKITKNKEKLAESIKYSLVGIMQVKLLIYKFFYNQANYFSLQSPTMSFWGSGNFM